MDKGQGIWRRLTRDGELGDQPLPGRSLVELAGRDRVLIENHQGVLEYSRQRIGVRVKFGSILVCGQCLELRHMTRDRLVICGNIQGVTLEGGKSGGYLE